MTVTQDEAALLSDRQLILLAGEAAFGRGVDYYRQGMVLGWNKKGTTITAEVEGSELYHLTLTLARSGIVWRPPSYASRMVPGLGWNRG